MSAPGRTKMSRKETLDQRQSKYFEQTRSGDPKAQADEEAHKRRRRLGHAKYLGSWHRPELQLDSWVNDVQPQARLYTPPGSIEESESNELTSIHGRNNILTRCVVTINLKGSRSPGGNMQTFSKLGTPSEYLSRFDDFSFVRSTESCRL